MSWLSLNCFVIMSYFEFSCLRHLSTSFAFSFYPSVMLQAQFVDKEVESIFKHSVFFSKHFQTLVIIFSCDLIVRSFGMCSGQEGSNSSPLRRNSSASASMNSLASTNATATPGLEIN